MKESNRQDRRIAIEEAAFQLLTEKGFAATSMLAVAKAARASNETLYRWYGDKQGLFQALVARNSAAITDELADSARAGLPPLERLARVGPALLTMLMDPRTVALNRAAAADEGGALGQALARAGRETVAPLIADVIAQAIDTGALRGQADEMTELYLTLLIGDSQIRRVTGAMPPPGPGWVRARASRALVLLQSLAPPQESAGRTGSERLPDGKDPEFA